MSLLPALITGAGAGGGGSQSTTGSIIAGCRAASTIAFTVAYNNGSSGVGATLTNAGAQAQFTLDGYTPATGERVLIKDQASALQNGIYSVTNQGSVSTNWVLTRVTDFDSPSEMVINNVTEIFNGSAYAGTVWMLTATVVTVGTTAVTFLKVNLATTNNIPTGEALTKADDTNVTLTLGGSPTTALVHAASITAGWTGTLSGTRGGTGVNNGSSTFTMGGSVAFSGTFTFIGTVTGNTNVTFPTSGTLATTSQIPTGAALTKSDDTNVTLTLGGSPTTALINAASITAGWTGTLAVARGGTGLATTTAYGLITGGTTATGNFQNAGTGTAGQMYVSGGSAALGTWTSVATITFNGVSTNQTMVANNGYYITSGGALTFALPATAAAGTVLEIVGNGSTSWQIIQAAGQSVWVGNVQSTVGVTGNVISTNAHDSIELVCIAANTTWQSRNYQGFPTVT